MNNMDKLVEVMMNDIYITSKNDKIIQLDNFIGNKEEHLAILMAANLVASMFDYKIYLNTSLKFYIKTKLKYNIRSLKKGKITENFIDCNEYEKLINSQSNEVNLLKEVYKMYY